MSEYAVFAGFIGITLYFCAWREIANDNRRDAKLLAACGTGGMLTAAAFVF
ncbi:MAG: hypothetical protein ABI583_03390 [Betaproteobacteria bacterium]